MGQVSAGGEVQPEKRVARLHQREERRDIGRRAGMRLHVGERSAEQLLDPLDRQVLGNVDEMAAAVVAPSWQPFGVFVGEHRALRLEHGAADDVFRRDQLDLVALTAQLLADRGIDLGIAVGERGRKQGVRDGLRGAFRHGHWVLQGSL